MFSILKIQTWIILKEIRKIIEVYDSIDHTKEKVALASVVKVEASSYRRIGARMLVRSSGSWIGGISGGCLEGDALKRSKIAIFKNQPSKVVYDTMDDDANQIGVGLGCNGRIEVLFTPINTDDPNNDIEQLRRIVKWNQPAIILKVIEASNTSDLLGQSLLVNKGSEALDFAGLKAQMLKALVESVQKERKPLIASLKNEAGDEVELLVEFIKPETRLVIVGDNYDVNAMVGVVKELGWAIYIIGRAKKITKGIFKQAKRVVAYNEADQIPIDSFTAVVIMSHDYDRDRKALLHFIARHPKYIGLLGPKKRREKMQQEAEFEQYNLEALVNLHSPVGLDIGAQTPEEIAISVVAEIIATFRDRDGVPLKYRSGTIHERAFLD